MISGHRRTDQELLAGGLFRVCLHGCDVEDAGERDVVGVYLSVSPRLHRDIWVSNVDLFQNAVHAAIVD